MKVLVDGYLWDQESAWDGTVLLGTSANGRRRTMVCAASDLVVLGDDLCGLKGRMEVKTAPEGAIVLETGKAKFSVNGGDARARA
jgi:hypothetical protein